jgi:hypothetical protein
MKATITRRHKISFPWQDEKQESWLRKMSHQGLHLKEIIFGADSCLTRYRQGLRISIGFQREQTTGRLPATYKRCRLGARGDAQWLALLAK